MSVAVLLVTHKKIAASLVEVACSIVNDVPVNFSYAEIPMDASVENMESAINDKLDQLDQVDGTLILTDIYGSTPSNIATKFVRQRNTRLISGLNLPMLVKIMNYRDLPLAELSEKILNGGKESITLLEEGTS